MKKHIFLAIFLSLFSLNIFATSCKVDVNEMYVQIEKYQSITTINYVQIQDLYKVEQRVSSLCQAEC